MAERGGNEEVINLNSFSNHRGKGEYWFVPVSKTLLWNSSWAAGFTDTELPGNCWRSVLSCHTLLLHQLSHLQKLFSCYAGMQNIWLLSFSCCTASREIADFLGTLRRGVPADPRRIHPSEDPIGERLPLNLCPHRAACIGTHSFKSGIQSDAFSICLKGDKWTLMLKNKLKHVEF